MTTLAELVVKIVADSSQFEREVSGMSGKVRAIGEGMSKVGASLTKNVTLPIVGIGVAAFKMHKDFEYSMQQIVGLVGMSQEQVDQWGKDILEMGPKLGKGPKELADALYFITSAGIEASEALNVLEMSGKASAAGLGETKVIADLVTSAMNAYGAENLSAAQATDVLVAAVREGKAEAADMAGSLGKVLPIAAELGVEFHEVAAATAAMTRTGTDANTAGTQLRAIMSSLLKPTKQAEEVLNKMGTSSAELRKQIREEGLLSALMELRDLTHEYGEEAMAQVFPNIRALIGMLDLMGANIEDNVKIFENLTDATGALDHAFEAASQTAEFKWQQILSSLQVLMITIGDTMKASVIPVMEDMVQKIKSLTEWFQKLSPAQRTNLIRWAAYAAILGPILLIVGKLVLGFVKLVNVITVFSRGLRLAVGAIKMKMAALAGMKTVMALMAGPAGWIMLAVAAIGLIAVAWWKASQDSEDAIEKLRREAGAKVLQMHAQIRQDTIETVEAMIEQYRSLSEESIQLFKNMASSQAEIGEAGHELIMENLELEKEQKLAFLEEQYNEELAVLERLHARGLIESDEHYEALKAQIEQKYIDKQGVVEAGYIEINRITEESLKEHGYLTETALGKIVEIYEGMFEDIIASLEAYVLNYKAIEALKGLEVADMTAEEYKTYQKVVSNAFDNMRQEHEQHYQNSMRDLDTWLSHNEDRYDEYAEMVEFATNQYIDGLEDIARQEAEITGQMALDWRIAGAEIVGSVNTLSRDVTSEFESLSDNSLDTLGTMRFGILDIFKDLWKQLTGNSIVPDMVNDIIRWFEKLDDLKSTMKTVGGNIISGLFDGLRARWDSLKGWLSSVAESIKNAFDPNQRHSPSLVESVQQGAKDIMEAYKSISFSFPDIKTSDVVHNMSMPASLGSGAGGINYIDIKANYNVTSKEMAEHANADLVKKLQGRGIGGSFS